MPPQLVPVATWRRHPSHRPDAARRPRRDAGRADPAVPRLRERRGRALRRHETPPEIANAICASIDLQSGAPREQPLYDEMVETLAESYRRHAGSEPPDGYAEPTAQPLHPSQRRAPRAPAGAGSAANLETHFLAGLPLRPGTHAAEERARRATPERRADAQTSGATEQHGGHGTHRAPPHGATRCPLRCARHAPLNARPQRSRLTHAPSSPALDAERRPGRLHTAARHPPASAPPRPHGATGTQA